MAMGAQQVNTIIGQIVSDLNTQVGNRYIFGGTADNAPPFDTAGNYSVTPAYGRWRSPPGSSSSPT